ncbi:MAG TPA: Nif3-like dinuclear metal center hexameric protein [Candidatus Moranbacteria bacterium]|nr:Nif3-like dinuclear metal center hexameric protein [Candidatus Moranbacteria bacterium]
MNAKDLYQKLETDFELEKCQDDWSNVEFDPKFVTENFRRRYMGILADNTDEITKTYTAVFPSEKIMQELLEKREQNILLFTHHPVDWKIKKSQSPFVNLNGDLLQKFKENKISIYTMHTPLDRNGEYSTSVNFAKALGLDQMDEFAEYFGFLSGVIGKTDCKNISELVEVFKNAVGHEVKIWNYGESEIKDGKVAMVAGGGCDNEILSEIARLGINTFLTGVTFHNNYEPSIEAHKIAKENKINMIGGTHYSTEKFACIKMTEYFENIGLESEFIEGEPDMRDLG